MTVSRVSRLIRPLSIAAVSLAALLGASQCAAASVNVVVSGPRFVTGVVMPMPPAPRVEVIGVAPQRGYFWAPGCWNWAGGRHVWVSGQWMAPRVGYYWQSRVWVHVGGGWRLRESAWVRV